MANKKISELESRASLSLSDLMAVGDPSTGYLYKTTISDLKTLTGAGVVSFNGRFGTVNPAEGDYTLTQLGDVIITSPSNGQVLKYNGSNWVNATEVAEADTLDTVTGRGNTTANSITVGSVTAAGLSNLLGQIRTFATTGNTYIGASPVSATDAGYKVDINGTLRVQGRIVTGLGGIVNNCLYTYIGNHCGSSGFLGFGFVNTGDPGLGDSVFDIFQSPSAAATYPLFHFKHTAADSTGGSNALNIVAISTTVNQTSGSNGVVRGFYYNPTLTSINGSHFAFESTSGKIKVSDLSGSGSRMVVADANGVLSTQAIPSTSGFVTLDTTQTITALKTFTNVVTFNQNIVGGLIKLSQGVLLSKSANIGSDPGFLSLIATSSTGLNTINIADGDNTSFTQKLIIPNTGNYNYTFPSSSGTLALASDIPSLSNYVTLDGTQTITGAKTFSTLITAQHIKANYYGFPDSNGYSTGFESTSNNTIQVKIGSGLAINIASNNNATFYGNIIRNGGTSSQFLKADGSLDSSTYLTSASVSGVYLPLSGGTLTGALNGTTASFSGAVTATGAINGYAGLNGFAGATHNLLVDWSSESQITTLTATNLFFGTNAQRRMTILSSGNVGIATASPDRALTVNGQIGLNNDLVSTKGGTTFRLGYEAFSATGGVNMFTESSIPLVFGTNSGEKMRLTPGGNLALGTTSPVGSFQFHINRAGNTGMFISNTTGNSGGYLFAGGLDGLEIQSVDSANSAAKRLLLQPYGGNVGIGMTNPVYRLDVLASGGTNQPAQFASSTTNLYTAYRASSIDVGYIGNGVGIATGGSATDFGFNASNNMIFTTTGAVERMRITSGGNVLIGNTTGAAKFGVYGANPANTYMLIDNAGSGINYYAANSFHEWQTAGATRMTLTSGGNLELNTGSIKTGEPDTGYGRAAIKIGARNTGQAFSSAGHLPVSIDGTIYYINVYSSLP